MSVYLPKMSVEFYRSYDDEWQHGIVIDSSSFANIENGTRARVYTIQDEVDGCIHMREIEHVRSRYDQYDMDILVAILRLT